MKDGLMLLLTGVACAAGAALFFRLFGSDALNIIILISLIAAMIDNFRLRRRLRELEVKPEGKRI
ncbi:hypothetical protein [Duganella callida]|uniref:Uncharacterized protein n=1 Tax=Duganella callida TaxID=2561932 RepID=A0A4Y9SJY4_9BURK|nr:hypothetical protein [Duganella callida]TFW26635.1 hypothetical protein E4L98_08275 [Duganella callida]